MDEEEKQYRRMTENKIEKLVILQAIPTVVSMLITSLYNLADTYFVSNLGLAQSGAVSVSFSLMSLIQSIGFGLGMGSGSLISRALGKKDQESAERYAASALAAAFSFGVMVFILGNLFASPLMALLGAKDAVLPYAVTYARFISAGAPVLCLSFVINITLRSQGKATLSMIGLSAGALLNIALDPLFIRVFHWGVAGAALATLLSQFISFFILLFLFLSRHSIVRFHFSAVSRRFRTYFEIVTTGLPTIFRQGLASLSTACLNNVASSLTSDAHFNEALLAAVGIANRVYLFVRSVIVGIGQGFQPVAGFNYGAGKFSRVKRAFRFTLFIGTAICLISALLMAFFSTPIMRFFIGDADPEKVRCATRIGSRAILFLSLELPFLAYSTYVNQALQCLGKKISATFLASCRQGVFFLPLIFILPHFFSVTGVLITQPVADLCTFFISVPVHLISFQKLFPKEKK